ncbi:tRNA(His) guanylyltransferase Thg1 family protein [Candidatus Pacearchaeota archaeon]|jgi:tRNA(His) 5'-end guanylyltransferase|nr:tRNA(His) guanylyltransferase Thg1 family protein [Candidatus Pacearchaeota archaeon]
MRKDNLGNRMKENYENRYRMKLQRRTPVIIRLDGKAFHTLTRKCIKPFDEHFSESMLITAKYLCSEIQGCKCAYIQSDEISLLLTDFDTFETEAWFDYNIQKITSVSAATASIIFSNSFFDKWGIAVFDSRAFNIPKEEVHNYFLWRQLDWVRNSIQMLAQANFSHKELHGKNSSDMHEMLHTKNINWTYLQPKWKNGVFIIKRQIEGWAVVDDINLKEKKNVFDRFLYEVQE